MSARLGASTEEQLPWVPPLNTCSSQLPAPARTLAHARSRAGSGGGACTTDLPKVVDEAPGGQDVDRRQVLGACTRA